MEDKENPDYTEVTRLLFKIIERLEKQAGHPAHIANYILSLLLDHAVWWFLYMTTTIGNFDREKFLVRLDTIIMQFRQQAIKGFDKCIGKKSV